LLEVSLAGAGAPVAWLYVARARGRLMQSGYWRALRSDPFALVDRERTLALLPVAAVEQHGLHLPLATDALINEAVIALALALGVSGATLPAQQVGHSLEHTAFAGTLSIVERARESAGLIVGARARVSSRSGRYPGATNSSRGLRGGGRGGEHRRWRTRRRGVR